MHSHRLFEMIYILIERKKVTARFLAEHFEVSERTILRDLDVLTLAGIPIYTSKGKGGGIFIDEHFILDKAAFTDEEQNQILIGLQSLASTKFIESSGLESKLSALFHKSETNWIEVDFSRWGSATSDHIKFETLKTAVTEHKILSFEYASTYGEITMRTVHPMKLIYKSNAWYLVAHCKTKQSTRTFKISRMHHLVLHHEFFVPQSLAVTTESVQETSQSEWIHLKLQFAQSVAYRIYDEFDENQIQKNSDGTYNICVQVPKDRWLYGFLLSFGTDIKILEPLCLKDELYQHIKTLETFYA